MILPFKGNQGFLRAQPYGLIDPSFLMKDTVKNKKKEGSRKK
jgi:hypothetical protein